MKAAAWQETTSTPIADSIAPTRAIRLLQPSEIWDLARPAWQEAVAERLAAIQKLEEDWDGYGSGPIRRDVIQFAERVLVEIMRPDTPAPHITPMSHEGIMLEWHQNGIDLEIEIEKPGSLWVSFEDSWDLMEDERSLSSNLWKLAAPIGKLTDRAIARK